MSYTPEVIEAERNLKAAMDAWKIVQEESPETGTGVFIDTDTEQNSIIVPTRMEYVRHYDMLEVTRITQGDRVIFGRNANGTCHASSDGIMAFFEAQPEMEAVATAYPTPIAIPFHECQPLSR